MTLAPDPRVPIKNPAVLSLLLLAQTYVSYDPVKYPLQSPRACREKLIVRVHVFLKRFPKQLLSTYDPEYPVVKPVCRH